MWENSHFTGPKPGRTQNGPGTEPAAVPAHQLSRVSAEELQE